jgi:hypothetical protein
VGTLLVAIHALLISPQLSRTFGDALGGHLRLFVDAVVTILVAAVALFAGARFSEKGVPDGPET